MNKSSSDDDEDENILQTNNSPQVGDAAAVKYETKRKVLTYLGIVHSVNGVFTGAIPQRQWRENLHLERRRPR